ncbi:MAG: hypothetical protein HZB61_12550 [Nitrospirae bacterium]|nr:hypothetical protein [Nitrospirota bacterium]
MNIKIVAAVIALFVLCGINVLTFAQKAEGKTAKKNETKTFTGKVEEISLADPVKGTKSEIVVTDVKSKKVSFLVTSTTTLYGVKSAAITLDKIKKSDKVKVKYTTTKEGVNEAVSVRIVP